MRVDVSGFTEAELVEAIRRILSGGGPGVVLGPGDDAALVERGPNLMALTVDMLVEDVHFVRAAVSPRDLGYKALVVNVSDVAAMGGSPRYAVVALAIPSEIEGGWVVELYGGLREAADEYAVSLVGGDTSRADCIVVSVTVTGEVPSGGAVSRSGAEPGDRIVVTGELGAAAGGLRLAAADPHEVGAVLAADWAQDLLQAHLRPVARVGEGQALARVGATSMIDLSDGMAIDLRRLCKASGVGAAVSLAAVPVAASLDELKGILPIDPLDLALAGGEDYELLATVPPAVVDRAAAALLERFGTQLTDIGAVTVGDAVVTIEPDGTEVALAGGWDHFGT